VLYQTSGLCRNRLRVPSKQKKLRQPIAHACTHRYIRTGTGAGGLLKLLQLPFSAKCLDHTELLVPLKVGIPKYM
jgi:hypothetical protein